EPARDLGDEDLAAAGRLGNAGRDEHGAPEVAALLGDDVAGVRARAHGHADVACRQRPLDLDRAAQRGARALEGEHELVALALDLDAAGALERLPHEPVVLLEDLARALVADLLDE